MIKINDGTPWECEIDPSVKVGDYVQLTRKYSGKRVGIWEVIEFKRVVVDANNAMQYTHYDYRQGYNKIQPPIGMEMVPELKVARVMSEYYDEKPSRRDTTKVTLDRCDKVTPRFIADLQAKYDKRTANLQELLAGTWV